MEERRQSYENRPYMLSMLRINELAYGDYWPYAHSTIGDMQDLVNAPLEAVQEFFRHYYAPNNAVVSIAGDFDPDEALALVREHFGDIERRDVPSYDPPEIQPQTTERTDSMIDPHRGAARLPHRLSHPAQPRPTTTTPSSCSPSSSATGSPRGSTRSSSRSGRSSQEISVSTDDRRGPDLFSVWGVVASNGNAAQARNVIYDRAGEHRPARHHRA